MTDPDNIRAGMAWRDKARREVFAAGRIPSKKEKRLRKRVGDAEYQYEEYGGHGAEIALALARRDLREYLQDKGRG